MTCACNRKKKTVYHPTSFSCTSVLSRPPLVLGTSSSCESDDPLIRIIAPDIELLVFSQAILELRLRVAFRQHLRQHIVLAVVVVACCVSPLHMTLGEGRGGENETNLTTGLSA